MTTRRTRAVCSLLVLLVATSIPGVAAAQGAPPPAPLSASLAGEAKAAYDSGKDLFEIGDFSGAYLKFEHAFELSNDPRLLWNMAACQKELHHYGRAVPLVERYLKEGGARLTPEARDNATTTLPALRALTSAATVTGAPSGAQIFVDDELVGSAPLAGPLSLDIGMHKVRVEHPEFQPFERRLEGVTGGGTLAIVVTMAPLVAARLQVLAGPGDTVAVDGTVVGSERWEGTVTPGLHKVRVTAVGKTPYDASVALASRASRTVQVTLRPESKTVLWPWLVGGAAVVAGGVVGGYFLLRPDNEPGPYTSGGLGTVILPAGRSFP
jgi:hypothetical protein